MIDLILYTNDQYKQYTLEYAKAYVKASRILESNKLSEISAFIKDSPNDYVLFVGGTARLNSRVLTSILTCYDDEIKTFNLSDLHEPLFEPKEPCFSYFEYSLDLSKSKGPFIENRGRMKVDYLNPIFGMTKKRFLSLGELEDRVSEHLELYFSHLKPVNNVLDTDVTVAAKVLPSVNDDDICYIGNKFVYGFKEAYELLRGKPPKHPSQEPALQGDFPDIKSENAALVELALDFYRLAYKYKGRSASILLTDKIEVTRSDIMISVINSIPSHYYIVARQRMALLIDNTNGTKQKMLSIKLANGPKDGFLFRDNFSNFDCLHTLALQVAGFMGFSEIQIYHEGELKPHTDTVINILSNSGIKIIRHSLC